MLHSGSRGEWKSGVAGKNLQRADIDYHFSSSLFNQKILKNNRTQKLLLPFIKEKVWILYGSWLGGYISGVLLYQKVNPRYTSYAVEADGSALLSVRSLGSQDSGYFWFYPETLDTQAWTVLFALLLIKLLALGVGNRWTRRFLVGVSSAAAIYTARSSPKLGTGKKKRF